VNRFVRARRQGVSGCHPHPDANQTTARMPFAQLRSLVLALIDADPPAPAAPGDDNDDDPDAAVREFDMQPTTYRPPPRSAVPKASTRFPSLDTALSELGGEPS
jgi:hypothetical protein